MISHAWAVPLFLLPLIPKVQVVSLGGVSILLDDAVLVASVGLGVLEVLTCGAKNGRTRLRVCPATVAFFVAIAYKVVNLTILGLFLPWSDLRGIGQGVLFTEGVLVVFRHMAFLVAFALLYSSLGRRLSWDGYLRLFFAVIAAVAAMALWQFIVLDHRVLTTMFRNIHAIRQNPQWQVGNPWLGSSASGHEHLAAFSVLSGSLIGGLLSTYWIVEGRGRKWMYVLGMASVFMLIFASSRGGWIGGVVAFLTLQVFLARAGKLRFGIAMVFLAFATLVGLQVLTNISIERYVGERTEDLLLLFEGRVVDDSAQARLGLLRHLWGVYWQRPITGYGPGGAGRIAEGQYIRELVEGGAVGSLLVLVTLYHVVRAALWCYQHGQTATVRGIGVGFVCATAGLLAQSFFTELFIVVKVAVPFWLLAALVQRAWIDGVNSGTVLAKS